MNTQASIYIFALFQQLYEFDEEIYYRHIVNDSIKDIWEKNK